MTPIATDLDQPDVLPGEEGLVAAQAGARGVVPRVPLARPLVLIVDDDEDCRETLATMIGCEDCSVVQAATGEAALRIADVLPVDVIFLDVLLPDWTGFEICRMLRESPRTRRIPVVMVTALTRVADELTGILAGADAYLIKPVSRRDVVQRLWDVV